MSLITWRGKCQKLALGRGSPRGLGEEGVGKPRLSQMVSLSVLDSQTERVTYHCLAELSYFINKLVLAFSDTGISGICV